MKGETVGREGAEPIPTVLSFNVYNTTMTGCGVELVDYVNVTDTVLWPRNRQTDQHNLVLKNSLSLSSLNSKPILLLSNKLQMKNKYSCILKRKSNNNKLPDVVKRN